MPMTRELRPKSRGVNYRILYFFHGQQAAVVSHGVQKQQEKVPPKEIALTNARMTAFKAEPKKHTFEE